MSRSNGAPGFRVAAFGVLLAFCSVLHGLGYRFTARDGLLDTPENCDAACRAAWDGYAARGNVWFALGGVVLVVSVGLGIWFHRAGRDNG